MGLFGNFYADPRMEKQALISKYNAARLNILAVVIFTAINMVSLATNPGSYFLFSANTPYMLTFFGMFLCGMLPEDYYKDFEGMVYFDKSFFVIMLIISIFVLAFYVLCWFLSKKGKSVWLKIALGLFIADTALMFVFGSAGMLIVDLIFHIWVIAILVSGIKAQKKLSDMPKEDEIIEAEYREITTEDTSAEEEPVVEATIEAPTENPHEENDTEESTNEQ